MIRISCTDTAPRTTMKWTMDASRMLPMPSVVAFVGACRRVIRSRSLISPAEPTSRKRLPTTMRKAISSSSRNAMASASYSMMSPRRRKRQKATVEMKPNIDSSRADSK